MNGSDVALAVSGSSGYPRQLVWTVIRAVFDAIETSVANGHRVTIRNFGSFRPRVSPREGRTMNGSDVAQVVSEETGVARDQVWKVVTLTFETIAASVKAGRRVTIRNFGSFKARSMMRKNDLFVAKSGKTCDEPPGSKMGLMLRKKAGGTGSRVVRLKSVVRWDNQKDTDRSSA